MECMGETRILYRGSLDVWVGLNINGTLGKYMLVRNTNRGVSRCCSGLYKEPLNGGVGI